MTFIMLQQDYFCSFFFFLKQQLAYNVGIHLFTNSFILDSESGEKLKRKRQMKRKKEGRKEGREGKKGRKEGRKRGRKEENVKLH